MGWFRLNALSVGSLTTTILLGVITGYLLSLRRKGRETWYLAGYLGSLFVLLLAYTARYSIFSPAALAAGQFANLIVFGVACLIQFAYWFGGNPYRRESRVVLLLSLGASLAVWGSLFAPGRYPPRYDFYAEYFTYEFGPSISILALIEYLWALLVFLRRALVPATGPRSGARAPARRLLRPTDRLARSHRSFALLTFATIPIALQYLLYRSGIVSQATYAIAFNTGALLICLLIFLVYVTNAPRPVSFLVKIVGVPLAVLMVFFGIASNAIMPVVETTIMERYRAETALAETALQTQELGSLPADVAYLLPTTSELDTLRFGAPPVYRPGELLLRAFPAGARRVGAPLVASFHYLDPTDTSSFYFSFPLYHAGELFGVGFSYAAFRQEVHDFAWKLAAIVVVGCLAVVLGFPLVFRRSLIVPLTTLLAAVGRVARGNFRETLTASTDDEIGQLSHGYNRMIEALRGMEGNFKALAENASDAILVVSGDGKILFTNARAAGIAGLPPERLEGMCFEELMADQEALEVWRKLTRESSDGRRPGTRETRVRRADGAVASIELSTAATMWETTPAVVVVARDVTERRRAEELLRGRHLTLMRTDKLASLGELVAGVAHEINNPNHVVAMGVRFLGEGMRRLFALAETSAELDETLRIAGKPFAEFKRAYEHAVGDIETSAKRIDHIVSELKRFVRGSSPRRAPVDINEVVRSVVDLSRYTVEQAGARLVLELCDRPIEVSGDFVELEQVVLNLIENACQALGGAGGEVAISTRLELHQGCIRVRDTGAGIPEGDLDHILEPFFTTRGGSGGSGLGLSVVNRIVRSHSGELVIESRLGSGTMVTVWLPCTRASDRGST